jgi:hypothetical protein
MKPPALVVLAFALFALLFLAVLSTRYTIAPDSQFGGVYRLDRWTGKIVHVERADIQGVGWRLFWTEKRLPEPGEK